jgi:uncharacterized protein YggE
MRGDLRGPSSCASERFSLVFLAALLALASAQAVAQDLASPSVSSVITRGEAVLRRPPDHAIVVAAVVTRARSPRDAQQQNAAAMSSVQQRLAGLGLAKDAIRTLGYTIQQEFDFPDGRRVSRGYVANNAIEVRLDAIERVGETLDIAVQAGATSVEGVRFELRDRGAVEREALRLAVVDARARADAAAAGAGRTVDRVLRIDDSRQPQVRGPLMMAAQSRALDGQLETPVAPGLIEVHAEVVLTVSIK